MKNETYFKLGQRVGSYHNGDGTILAINPLMEYPIFVTFDNGNKGRYTFDGKIYATDKSPSISQKTGINPIVNTPIWEPKDGEYIWCKIFSKGVNYFCFPFKRFEQGSAIVYQSQTMENANEFEAYDIHPLDKPPFSPK